MKKWCECNPRCMVKNPRKEIVHGSYSMYESRHNCRCTLCSEAYKQHVLDCELVLISKYLERSFCETNS
jgi:hypothetical protein